MGNDTIQITPTIIGVVVPNDAFGFKTEYEDKYTFLYAHLKSKPDNHSYFDEETFEDYYNMGVIAQTHREDGVPKFKIHGTCTLPELEFDFEVAESWVESKWFIRIRFYKDYIKSKNNAITKEDSFRTRIQKAIFDAGLLLINPIEIKGQTFSNEHQNKWQESKSKVIRGKLLIIEKI